MVGNLFSPPIKGVIMKTKCPICGASGSSSTKCGKCSSLIPEPVIKIIKKVIEKTVKDIPEKEIKVVFPESKKYNK